MKLRRWLGLGLVVAAAGAAIGWVALRPVAVDAVRLAQAPLVRTVQFSARVATLARVDVGSTVTGRVTQVLVREGDAVARGAPLLRLEQDEARAALAQARANEAQATANVQATRAELQRAQALVNQGFISSSRLDETRRAQDVAGAQQRAAEAATLAAQARLALTEVRAPDDARVLQRQVEPGQIVQPGKALLTLALAGPTQFKAQVDERFLQQLAIGQPGWVVADAFPGERLDARVSAIAPSIDAQRGAVEVTLTLTQPAPDFLREDMTLSVEVETARREQALTLPLSALRPAMAGQDEVLVLHEGRAQARQVRLGLRNLQAVEVTDGLAAGDTVLLGEGISASQRVSPRLLTASELALHQNRVSGGSAATALTNAMGR